MVKNLGGPEDRNNSGPFFILWTSYSEREREREREGQNGPTPTSTPSIGSLL
jgi:hypothetical protein